MPCDRSVIGFEENVVVEQKGKYITEMSEKQSGKAIVGRNNKGGRGVDSEAKGSHGHGKKTPNLNYAPSPSARKARWAPCNILLHMPQSTASLETASQFERPYWEACRIFHVPLRRFLMLLTPWPVPAACVVRSRGVVCCAGPSLNLVVW